MPDERVERLARLICRHGLDGHRNTGCLSWPDEAARDTSCLSHRQLAEAMAAMAVVALAPGEVVVTREPTEAMNRAAASSYARTTGASETVPMYAALCAAIEAGADPDA